MLLLPQHLLWAQLRADPGLTARHVGSLLSGGLHLRGEERNKNQLKINH